MTLTLENARKVLEVVDAGLCNGMGRPEPGQMCVEAAVCYALGQPHGDSPTCVGSAVRAYKITLNDARWSSTTARAAGLREIAVCQLGSRDINQTEFAGHLALLTIQKTLPIALRGIGLIKEAEACEQSADLTAAYSAASAAYSAAYSAASAAYSAASAAESAASAASAAESAASAAYSAASAAYSAAESAASAASAADDARDGVLKFAASVGVEALKLCCCAGVELWNQLHA